MYATDIGNDYYDDGGGSSSGSSLTQSVLSSLTNLAQTEILAANQQPVNTGYPYRPPTNVTPLVSGTLKSSGSGTLLFFGIIVVVVLFLFRGGIR